MDEKTFERIMKIIAIVGTASMIALFIYTYIAFKECGIIGYIARGR